MIGNLTRDPELRYTPQGTAVCTVGLATNRTWTTEQGEKKEDAEFHRLVAWNKLAELCAQLLFKGRRVYVEGRLQTRTWTAQDGTERQTTEIVINDMIILDSKRAVGEEAGVVAGPVPTPSVAPTAPAEPTVAAAAPTSKKAAKKTEEKEETADKREETPAEVTAEDIPF